MAVLPVGIGPVTGYQIERSLRFNSADSAYLNRTFGAATGTTKGTWSGWVKRGTLGTQQHIFSSSNYEFFEFQSTDKIRISNIDGNAYWITTQVFRDPSAWYHFVIAWDSTLATATDRCKFWVNGVRVTQWDSQTTITQNTTFARWNVSGYGGSIGRFDFGGTWFLSAYQTEIYWIDGQALTPSSFGETDSNTGVWKPKAYTGTYGTNGFYLKFADNSGTTSTTLGKDSSGNGNNWTPNNFSVTAGAGNDSLVDTPTAYGTDTGAGGTVRGNYCTWSPIDKGANASTLPSNGNLDFTLTSASGSAPNAQQCATLGLSSGKWYWEVSYSNLAASGAIGIIKDTWSMNSNPYTAASGNWYAYANDGTKYNGSTNSSYGATWTTSDVIGIALDMDAGTITFYKNGSSQGQAFSGISGTFKPHVYVGSSGATSAGNANFGQRAFAYTAPSGFKALCTQNLPTPTIGATSTTQAGKYFNPVIYAGSASQQVIDSNLSVLDLAWIKNRTTARDHVLVDTVRGGSPMLTLYPNQTYAEDNSSPNFNPTSISGSSITLGGAKLGINNAGENFVMWGWNAGGSTVTNTSGTISAQVRANTTSGFSIVTYTGNATSGATIGHGLGVAPSMVIVKNRSTATNWPTWHTSIANTELLKLNLTDAKATDTAAWNSTTPTSTVVTLGNSTGTNGSGNSLVAYCFANVEGYSRAFSYTGNGSSDGPFVFLGFRPRFVMIKRTDSTANWEIWDTTRSVYNQTYNALYPNLSNAEDVGNAIDINSNGFKLRDTGGSTNATSSATYIGFAVAENPFKYSLAR